MNEHERRLKFEHNRDRVMAKVRRDVKRFGQVVMFIGGDKDHTPFHYTVGRGKRGLPELLIAAPLQPQRGMDLLNALDKAMPHPLETGTLFKFPGANVPVKILDADRDDVKDTYTGTATAFYGSQDRYRVQQVLLADKDGRFPGDAGCAEPYSRQPLLSKRVLLQ